MTHHYSLDSIQPQVIRKLGLRSDAKVGQFPALSGMSLSHLKIDVGGIREPHWHPNAHELSYCIKGKGLVTVFGNHSNHETFVIEAGDLAFIPEGSIHAIENIGMDTLELAICFNHERPEDFELSTSVSAIPDHILGATFGISSQFFTELNHRKESVFIGERLSSDMSGTKLSNPLCFALENIQAQLETHGGWVKKCYGDLFPALQGLTAYSLLLQSEGVREPHWHPNAHELNFLIKGKASIFLHLPNGEVETFDMEPGDVSFLPKGYPHYIETVGNDSAHFIVFFNHIQPADIGFSGALGAYTNDILAATLGGTPQYFEKMPKYQENLLIVPL